MIRCLIKIDHLCKETWIREEKRCCLNVPTFGFVDSREQATVFSEEDALKAVKALVVYSPEIVYLDKKEKKVKKTEDEE